jgi:hypothetical protein
MGFDIAAGSLAIDPIAAEGLPENDNAEESRLALCDMVQKYEKPPVDRKVLCAQEALREWSELGYEGEEYMIGVRTIELWEGGFGE